jgi:hypothetical protein
LCHFETANHQDQAMKKLAAAMCLAGLLPLGGCVVYGPGPAANPAWANYDFTYDYGLSGYDRPVLYGDGYGYGYAGGYGVSVGVSAPADYGSYYSSGGYPEVDNRYPARD